MPRREKFLLWAAALALAALHPAALANTIRLGVLEPLPGHENLTYQPGESNVVEQTVAYLGKTLPEMEIKVSFFNPANLPGLLRERVIDFALVSSGQFVELSQIGIHPLANIRTSRYPDPNRVSGAAFITTADHPGLDTIESMRGMTAVYNHRDNFINGQIPRAVIAKAGFDPDRFFSRELTTLNHPQKVLDMLLSGEADVGVLRVCELEALTDRNPEYKGRFRAIADMTGEGEVCRRSTDLYPGWTMTVMEGVSPRFSRILTGALLAMPMEGENGISWSIATEFSRVNEVFRLIKEGPYSYLREWTLKRVFVEYGYAIVIVLSLIIAYFIHSLDVKRLAQSRARELASARVKLDDARIAAAEAESRIAALSRLGVVSQLSGILAHEMGQPLSAIAYRIKAMKSLLSRDAPDKEKLSECLCVIEKQVEKAGNLLRQVRGYAKGRTKRSETVRLDLVVENIAKDLTDKMGGRDRLRFRTLDRATVTGDSLELHLAVLNIVRNAVQATEGEVTLSLRTAAGKAVFECVNGGRAVTQEDLNAWLSPVGSRKEGGIGLGILLIRSIAEAHGGKCEFLPCESGGLDVKFEVPTKPQDGKPRKSEE